MLKLRALRDSVSLPNRTGQVGQTDRPCHAWAASWLACLRHVASAVVGRGGADAVGGQAAHHVGELACSSSSNRCVGREASGETKTCCHRAVACTHPGRAPPAGRGCRRRWPPRGRRCTWRRCGRRLHAHTHKRGGSQGTPVCGRSDNRTSLILSQSSYDNYLGRPAHRRRRSSGSRSRG